MRLLIVEDQSELADLVRTNLAREGFAVSVVEGAGSVVIADNIIDGADRAIVGYRWSDPVTGDLAHGDGGGFRHLRIEKNLVS